MSRRRKHVTLGMRDDTCALEDGHSIGRVLGARGGNIFEIEFPSGRQTLCMIPQKFNKKLYIRRGGFVIVEEFEEAIEETKVTGTISQVLYDDQIKELKRTPGVWPPEFNVAISSSTPGLGSGGDEVAACDASAEDDEVLAGALSAVELGPSAGGEGTAPADTAAGVGERGVGSRAKAAGPSSTAAGAAGSSDLPQGGSEQQPVAAAGCANGQPLGVEEEEYEEEEDDDDLPPLFENNNRKIIYHEVDTDSDEEG